jgi:hypothetical protein
MSGSAAGAAGESKAVEEAAAHAAAEAEAKAKAVILTILHKRRFPDCENWIAEETMADLMRYSDDQWIKFCRAAKMDESKVGKAGVNIYNDIRERFGKPACFNTLRPLFPSSPYVPAKLKTDEGKPSLACSLFVLPCCCAFCRFALVLSRARVCCCTLANERSLGHTLTARSRMQQNNLALTLVCFCLQTARISR